MSIAVHNQMILSSMPQNCQFNAGDNNQSVGIGYIPYFQRNPHMGQAKGDPGQDQPGRNQTFCESEAMCCLDTIVGKLQLGVLNIVLIAYHIHDDITYCLMAV